MRRFAPHAERMYPKFDGFKIVNFGSRDHQHYKDRTPLKLWSHLDHNDNARRDRFYARHKNNNGIAAQLSKKYLW
jgi:hypothetical protein